MDESWNCGNCRFHRNGEYCHRRSPATQFGLRYHVADLLQSIARAQQRIAGLIIPDKDDALADESTEAYEPIWPAVDEDDWCGEHEPR